MDGAREESRSRTREDRLSYAFAFDMFDVKRPGRRGRRLTCRLRRCG